MATSSVETKAAAVYGLLVVGAIRDADGDDYWNIVNAALARAREAGLE